MHLCRYDSAPSARLKILAPPPIDNTWKVKIKIVVVLIHNCYLAPRERETRLFFQNRMGFRALSSQNLKF